MGPAPFQMNIVDGATPAGPHSLPPDGSTYAAKMKRRADNVKGEPDSPTNAESPSLTTDDHSPLTKPEKLEAKDPHWKQRFKVGDEFELNGVRLVVYHIGKRSVVMRPHRD